MFEFIRSHQKLMQVVLLIFIAPAFVLLGVSGYSTAPEADALAVVGDSSITQQEFDQAKRNQIERARQQSGPDFDPASFDTPQANEQLLQALINDYLIQKAVEAEYLTASDQALQEIILGNDLFQENGRFNKETYNRMLAARGLSPSQYEANLRYNLARAQVLDPLLAANFTGKSLANYIDNAQLSGKAVRTRTLSLAPFLSSVSVSDEEIQNYYEANQAQFLIPESVDVEYLVLDPAIIKESITVSDADIQAYYEQNKQRFTSLEERKARHILFTLQGDASEEEVKAKAQEVLDRLQTDPSQFAALAKEFSEDPGSAENGGDLGFFRRGLMVPAFDSVVFDLEKNELSGLVKTDFGFHIIEVTDIKGGDIQPLAEVRDQIVEEIRGQKLTLQMAEAQNTFSEKVFEAGQSFDEVEQALGLQAQTQNNVTRSAAQVDGILGHPDILEEIFSEDSLSNRNNTKAVTVEDSLVSARVLEYRPATAKPLEEVSAEVRNAIRTQKASEAAYKEAQALEAKLKDEATRSEALVNFSEEKTVSALTTGGLPALATQSILDIKASDLPASKVVGLGDQGYLVAWATDLVPASQIKADAEPRLVNAYESIARRAYNEALALAARDALAERIGVEELKDFNAQE
ncbi:MAG: SurA N-terminal domain-containing protein [Limnobacter sp.]|nr:SurA N-terminal domain-containing protein [Limnobacter sp.]